MEYNKENLLKAEGIVDNVNEELSAAAVGDSDTDDGLSYNEQHAELMGLMDDPKIMKAYRAIRRDIYGVGERRPVSKKEKKKKKAKRRMAKKSKR
jgi:hypothetical protein